MAIPFLQSISVPGILLTGFNTGVLVNSSGTVNALSGTDLVLANGTTVLQSTFQPSNTKLTSFASLANASGSLTNNGSGTFSYVQMLPLAGGTMTGTLTVPASTSSSAGFSLQQGAAPTTPGNGDFWITSSGVYAQVAGSTLKMNANGALYYSSTTAVYITNTITAGSLGSTSLTSAAMTPGNVVSVLVDGYVKYNTLSDIVTITVRVATTDITFTIPGTSIPSGIVNTNYHWKLDGRLTPSTGPGAGSTVKFFGRFSVVGSGAEYISDISQSMAIDTSTNITFDLRAQWSGTGANNSIGSEYMVVQQINSIGGGGGSVISVALSAPSIFTVTGSPITSSGTLGFAWNGSSSDLVRADGSTIAAATYQPLDDDLTSIAGLAGTNGFLKKTAANTWSLDTNTYLTANQSITWTGSGDVSGSASGGTSISPALTVTAIQGKSITLASGLLRYDGTAFSFDSSTYLTANQTITLSGAVTGTGTTAITTTLASSIVGLNNLANLAANSVIANVTGSSATPTAVSLLTTATASSVVLRDSSANIYTNNILEGYATTITAAGTTTLTVASSYQQFFTGTSTQTVVLPVTSTLSLGHVFSIVNNSTGSVTVQSSGANSVLVLAGGTSAVFTCILTSGTTAASWSYVYVGMPVASGKKLAVSNTLTLAGTDSTTMTFPATSASIARIDAAQTFTGTQTFSGKIVGSSAVDVNGMITAGVAGMGQYTTGWAWFGVAGGNDGVLANQQGLFVGSTVSLRSTGQLALIGGGASTAATLLINNGSFILNNVGLSNGVVYIDGDNYLKSVSLPSSDGYVLSSTTTGVLSWVAPGQAITLSGDITGTGTATITTTLASTISGTKTFGGLVSTGILNASYQSLGYQAVTTAAGTTTLTATSTHSTEFTGTTTQTCVLPDATTLIVGRRFELDNNSTGLVTVNTNGGATLLILASGTVVRLTCTSITTAAGTWEYDYIGALAASGKKLISNNTLTLAGTDATTMTFPSTSASIARIDAAQTFAGDQTFSGNVYYGPGSLIAIPAAPLNMLASSAGTVKTQVNIINTGGGAGAGAAIDFYTYDVAGSTTPGMRIAALDNSYSADFVVYTKIPNAPGNALSERFRITNAGVGTLPGGLTCSGGGIGYATGAGGTVTQATSKSTGVTLSKLCGTITMNSAALAAATTVSFTLTNTFIAANDIVVIQHSSVGTLGAYNFAVTPAAGSASIAVRNVHTASLSEAIILRFIVVKAVVA